MYFSATCGQNTQPLKSFAVCTTCNSSSLSVQKVENCCTSLLHHSKEIPKFIRLNCPNIAFAVSDCRLPKQKKTLHMQLVLVPAEAITTPVEPNPSHAVHLMPAPAEISQTIISRSFCATASKNTILDLRTSNTQLSGICIFFLYYKQDWFKTG